jgi:hypothetical protein
MYSPDMLLFDRETAENPSKFFPYFVGTVQPLGVQVGTGKPSARLGSAAVVRNSAITATASMSRFTVVLLCERIRTVIHCRRHSGFLNLVHIRCLSGNRKFDET